MFQWQVVFHARFSGGFDIIIVEAKDIKTLIEERFPHDADRIVSITKLLDY